jgi:hypothetical protein
MTGPGPPMDPEGFGEPQGGAPMDPEGFGEPQGGAPMDPDARRRIGQAVTAGQAVTDPAEAAAAVELARLAQRRLAARTIPSALRISAGVTVAWLLLAAVPVTLGTGVHLAALAAGLGVGVLLFSVILLLGRRQLGLARRAERRNLALLDRPPG